MDMAAFLNNLDAPCVKPNMPKKELEILKVIKMINSENRILVILRGLPGSGKSTLAKRILEDTIGFNFTSVSSHVLSTDDYFNRNGRYNYQPNELQLAHMWNQNRAYKAMSRGFSPVIIDNTNCEAWEMKPYLAMATEHCYVIEILEPPTSWVFQEQELVKRNTHGVPKETIRKMIDRYERNLTVPKLLSLYNLTYKNQKPPILRPDVSRYPQSTSNASMVSSQYNGLEQDGGNFKTKYSSKNNNFSEINCFTNGSNDAGVLGMYEPIGASNFRSSFGATELRNTTSFHNNFERDSARVDANPLIDFETGGAAGYASNYFTDFKTNNASNISCEMDNASKQQTGSIITDLSAWGLTEQALRSWDLFTPITTNNNDTSINRKIETKLPCLLKDYSNASVSTEDPDYFVGVLTAVSRDINRGNTASQPVSPPSMLDKSCMTDDICNDNYDMQLTYLNGMFPDMPVDRLKYMLDKSQGDMEWAIEMLLALPKEEAMNIEYLENGKAGPSGSSSSVDINSQPVKTISKNSKKKKKKRNRKKNSLNVELQRDIERKIDINDEHYSGHLLKVKQKRFDTEYNDDVDDYLYPDTKNMTNGGTNDGTVDILMDTDEHSDIEVMEPVNKNEDSNSDDLIQFPATPVMEKKNKSPEEFEMQNSDENKTKINAAIDLDDNTADPLNKKTTTTNFLDKVKNKFTPSVSKKNEPTNRISDFIMKHFTLPVNGDDEQNKPGQSKTTNIFSRLISHSNDDVTADEDKTRNTEQPSKKPNNVFARLFSNASATDPVKKRNEKFNDSEDNTEMNINVAGCSTSHAQLNVNANKDSAHSHASDPTSTMKENVNLDASGTVNNRIVEQNVESNLCSMVKNAACASGGGPSHAQLNVNANRNSARSHASDPISTMKENVNLEVSGSVNNRIVEQNVESNLCSMEENAACASGGGPSTSGIKPAPKDDCVFEYDSDIEFDDLANTVEVQPTETIEMNLGEMFVEQLEAKLGDESLIYPKGFQPVIQMPVTLAKQLYAFYIESVFQQMEAQKTVLEELVKEDEEFARRLAREIEDTVDEPKHSEPNHSNENNLDEIMREQARARRAQGTQRLDMKDMKPETIAMTLTQEKLFASFPHIEHHVILEIFKAHDSNYDETVETLLSNSNSKQLGQTPNQIRQPPIDERLVMDMNMEHDDYIKDHKKFNTEVICNINARAHREAATKYLAKRTLLYDKAQHYHQKRMPAIALYYSSLAAKQTELYDRANGLAATSFLHEHSKRLSDINTLDLHYLFVKEAVEALDMFVDKHIDTLRSYSNDGRQNMYLQVITGRGRGSEGGIPKIRPAVQNRLRARNIQFQRLNPGLLKIKISISTLLTSEL